jgi:hypothetical protein
LAHADISELYATGNFVIHSDEIVTGLTERGLWQLKVPDFPDKHNWQNISGKSVLMWQKARCPTKQVTLRINALELGETWLSRIDAMQLQCVKKKAMTPADCKRYLHVWMNLPIEEKTRQRVLKPDQYHFMEHDKLNLPWQYGLKQGYLSMPVIIWMKKDVHDKGSTTSWSRVPQWSASASQLARVRHWAWMVSMTLLPP